MNASHAAGAPPLPPARAAVHPAPIKRAPGDEPGRVYQGAAVPDSLAAAPPPSSSSSLSAAAGGYAGASAEIADIDSRLQALQDFLRKAKREGI